MWSMLVTVVVIYVRGLYPNSCGICATKRVDCGMGSGIPTDSTERGWTMTDCKYSSDRVCLGCMELLFYSLYPVQRAWPKLLPPFIGLPLESVSYW
jgi:hypothetical protein